ncbi:glycoside hydrolase family 38 C-terminal domain-containing protein [Kutzneria sp. NPDC051319]|uniref:alpha-mannosidase n=1 Tax=Kutzneria sp. NPDC051319 TaxID=3155047 RepID=UPI00342809C7
MHDDRKAAEERVARFLAERVRPAVYSERIAMDVSPLQVGDTWGSPWSTTRFEVAGRIPAQWSGRVEAVFDLGFDLTRGPGGQAEALVLDLDGNPLQGLHPYHRSLPVSGPEVRLVVEAAANPPIVASAGRGTHFGSPDTAGDEHLYVLRQADLALRDEDAWHLMLDVEVLASLMRTLPPESPRRHHILRVLDNCVDLPFAEARGLTAGLLSRKAHDSEHTVVAVGHAHIDSAWLWPIRETIRKCTRTFTTVLALAEEYPELVFACSSAQQHAWIKEHQPAVHDRIRQAVKAGNWVPVGGMWVEADANLPGGESLARQLVHGARFFLDEFGVGPDGVWLPDSFGYTAAYPQLARLAGAEWFLTQKLSWNETNRLPHHTFWWEGIDGTRIFTHFPPVDTYNAELTGEELAHAVATYAEKGIGTMSLAPFGFGDGGGGPTREMLEKARRLRDLEGSPKVRIAAPSDFFREARAELPDAPVWRGELYLETHRGTYTSQARTKRGNRRSEALLRHAELWAASAAVRLGTPYPYEELDSLWKRVLLHQFHDILPGSSIAWVHREAEAAYTEIHSGLSDLISASAGDGESLLNAAPVERREVVIVNEPPPVAGQRLSGGRHAAFGRAPALGVGGFLEFNAHPVRATGAFVLDNGLITVHIDADGLVRSVRDHATGREAIAPGAAGNLLQLHPDDPVKWSAWNLDASYRRHRRDLDAAVSVELVDDGPLLAAVRVERRTERSVIVQHLRLAAGSRLLEVDTDVDWQERDTVLKAAWPLDVLAAEITAEIQFGHVKRPTHENTSWDAARFEAWAHRFVHVGEHGWGVALITDSTYGYDVSSDGRSTTVRLSLLRAPRSPDPVADQGRHRFRYGLRPAADIGDAITAGYTFSLPLQPASDRLLGKPLVSVDNPAVIVEAVKLADDRSGAVIVRLYESRGGRARAVLTADFPVTSVSETDLLERPLRPMASGRNAAALSLRPFQIVTLRLER